MKLQSEETEAAEETPASEPKLTIVVVLALLLGVLLTIIVVGAFIYYQQSTMLEAEVFALRDELKAKTIALDEVQEQNAALSRHVKVLKGYAIARSVVASEAAGKTESTAPVVKPVESGANFPETKPHSPEALTLPKAKKTKPETQDCELVGKSPEAQAATLRRCVGLLDPSRTKRRK
ncbi:hypothetical protein [Propionivibrio sp.]|uniref:hypothetical protein n=1 Tax=Propionivibrio sp. TaxID=2212460 RepID=UPI002607FE7D|nr:hypothetical protein [Propionivibrio sp.]